MSRGLGDVYKRQVEKGKEILSKSDLQIISADDLDDAAEKIVKAVKG